MSQLLSIVTDVSSSALAGLLVVGTWASLTVTTTLIALFHPSSARRRAALRVLDRLLRCAPSGGRSG